MVLEFGSVWNEDDWVLRGEGRANVVFGYVGTDERVTASVLRVAKRNKALEKANGKIKLLDQAVWAGVPGMNAEDKLERSTNYAREVIGPRLGLEYIGDWVTVNVPEGLRRDGQLENRGFLMTNTTVFTKEERFGWTTVGPVISLELKPKCGLVPKVSTIHPDHSAKTQVPKFALQQHLKIKQGRVKGFSQYSPDDVFSGKPGRVKRALWELLKTPQNNLRIFINGDSLPNGESGFRNSECEQLIKEALGHSFKASKRIGWELLLDVLIYVLLSTDVLSPILELQKMDRFDIEGVYPLYKELQNVPEQSLLDYIHQQTTAVPKQALHDFNSCRYECETHQLHDPVLNVHTRVECGRSTVSSQPPQSASDQYIKSHACLSRLSLGQKVTVLREYLMGATAKDCSVFVTLQGVSGKLNGEVGLANWQGGGTRVLSVGGANLLCKVSVADLDIKHVMKIDNHFRNDQRMMSLVKDGA